MVPITVGQYCLDMSILARADPEKNRTKLNNNCGRGDIRIIHVHPP